MGIRVRLRQDQDGVGPSTWEVSEVRSPWSRPGSLLLGLIGVEKVAGPSGWQRGEAEPGCGNVGELPGATGRLLAQMAPLALPWAGTGEVCPECEWGDGLAPTGPGQRAAACWRLPSSGWLLGVWV